jgi:tetratricopeptide (TPR) repeat protein
MKIQRNDTCPCFSGKKYKKCCLLTQEPKTFQPSKRGSLHDAHFTIQLNPELEDECHQVLEQIEAGDLANARKAVQRLYHAYPNDHMVNFVQGVCRIKEDDLIGAVPYFEAAIRIFPYFSEAYFNLASLHLKNVKIPEAVNYFRKVIEIEGEQEDIGQKAHKELQQLEGIIKKTSGCTLDEYVQNTAYFNRAYACLKEQKYQTAIVLFQQVLAIDPKHVQSYGNMALAYSGLGQNKIALECIKKALSIDPYYKPARNNALIISQLCEGERLPYVIKEIDYYKDGLI